MGDAYRRRAERTLSEAPDERFIQANERTLLAWLRTALAMLGFGFLIARVRLGEPLSHQGDTLLFVAGLGVLLFAPLTLGVAVARYWKTDKALREGRTVLTGPVTVAIIVSLIIPLCLAVAAALVATR